ncbi:hypothetical protein IFM12275_62360 [Nocardia sputorum]|nr:hypothetical protein IFM12275_62360 [Nocardia sputorum]
MDAVRARPQHEPCLRASGELDMLVSEVPFSFRRAYAIVDRCIEDAGGKWPAKPIAPDTVLVIEVVSPGVITVDCIA